MMLHVKHNVNTNILKMSNSIYKMVKINIGLHAEPAARTGRVQRSLPRE